MKKIIKKYKGVLIIAFGLIFNLVESLLVYRPEGVMFNLQPMSVAEWICDIISQIIIVTGFAMLMFDINRDSKCKIKEGLVEAATEVNGTIEVK